MKRSYLVTGSFSAVDDCDNPLTDEKEFLNKIFIVSHPREIRRQVLLYMGKRIANKYGDGAYFKQLSDLRIRRHERKMKIKKKREAINQQRLF
jgi:hypothetical protein